MERPLKNSEIEIINQCSRRLFLLSSVGFFVGCTSQDTSVEISSIPGPVWLDQNEFFEKSGSDKSNQTSKKLPKETNLETKKNLDSLILNKLISRKSWAKGRIDRKGLSRLGVPKYITLHHDALTPDPYYDTSFKSSASRLEKIRTAHRKRGWADIGYHFAIDPSGRLWECRPLDWQGAHVGGRNPSNIGVVVLGNFEKQHPTARQLQAISKTLSELMIKYDITNKKVFSHREWPNASTACPGQYLQSRFSQLRHRLKI